MLELYAVEVITDAGGSFDPMRWLLGIDGHGCIAGTNGAGCAVAERIEQLHRDRWKAERLVARALARGCHTRVRAFRMLAAVRVLRGEDVMSEKRTQYRLCNDGSGLRNNWVLKQGDEITLHLQGMPKAKAEGQARAWLRGYHLRSGKLLQLMICDMKGHYCKGGRSEATYGKDPKASKG